MIERVGLVDMPLALVQVGGRDAAVTCHGVKQGGVSVEIDRVEPSYTWEMLQIRVGFKTEGMKELLCQAAPLLLAVWVPLHTGGAYSPSCPNIGTPSAMMAKMGECCSGVLARLSMHPGAGSQW